MVTAVPILDLSPQETAGLLAEADPPSPAPDLSPGKLWRPRRAFITPDAYNLPHGRAMLERAEALGAEIVRLKANRLTGLDGGHDDPRRAYAHAKTSFAIVVSPPGARKLQPIPPSADWQFHLAQGCPAHCQYCYLAGSLQGPPITRAYANLPDILAGLRDFVGQGTVTSRSRDNIISRSRRESARGSASNTVIDMRMVKV